MAVFWNTRERRLRAGCRLLIQFALLIGLLFLQAIVRNAVVWGDLRRIAGSAAYLTAGLASVWLLGRFIDHRPFVDFGFHWNRAWFADLAFGFLVGTFMLTGVFCAERLAGWVQTSSAATARSGSAAALAVFISPLICV